MFFFIKDILILLEIKKKIFKINLKLILAIN